MNKKRDSRTEKTLRKITRSYQPTTEEYKRAANTLKKRGLFVLKNTMSVKRKAIK